LLAAISTNVIVALIVAVVVRQVSFRLHLAYWNPQIAEQAKANERVAERIEKMRPFRGIEEEVQARLRITSEEGLSPFPTIGFIGGWVLMFVGSLLAVAAVMWRLGGPLADTVWWAGPAYLAVRTAINIALQAYRREGFFSDDDRLTPRGRTAAWAAGLAILMATGTFYAFLPLGAIVFAALHSMASAVSNRLFPYDRHGLPPVA
jgi:hypothetical protein